ncbi:cytochrome-c oxidase, cbb3-type subunit III [Thalassospira xianhensis]|uniref:Cbb3-type cytochrome c oxidase subunit n=1 Tax=Thalassospira xianhensis MCCC 1A02616 TaxID=1177929 RepID=A0A367UC52_9PROT|nr:cytochrome-c oxidase, cbb3-type subunit III [Thalassospira xianhensis]RCK05739.1 cytochrome Cbb3 [Thalassospira xianhensis MCCC 1A02616]UKV14998.1 cytochrome-c oxidase, cbb3-type subunit III [Thalassospiraceae bacterium SW-3-3]
MSTHVEKDQVSGHETTGHEWDGIKELNTPLPSWWVYVFWATIVWSVGYWVVYPSWPTATSYLTGMFETTNRTQLHETMANVAAERAPYMERLAALDLDEIVNDSELLNFSMAGGKAVFAENCAPCHGTGGSGNPGFPSLQDDDWLWGGTLEAVNETVHVGVRWDANEDTRFNDMPAFGRDEILEREDINDVVQYVLAFTGRETDKAAANRGAGVFADNCASCHGEDAKGVQELGAPNLTDAIWLYGGDAATITETVNNSRGGVMPAWGGRLDEETIKMLTVYVHSLGGGQ